jgi:hypothetical protein
VKRIDFCPFSIAKINGGEIRDNYFAIFRENKDEYILNTMRDNMQLLVNALWQVN